MQICLSQSLKACSTEPESISYALLTDLTAHHTQKPRVKTKAFTLQRQTADGTSCRIHTAAPHVQDGLGKCCFNDIQSNGMNMCLDLQNKPSCRQKRLSLPPHRLGRHIIRATSSQNKACWLVWEGLNQCFRMFLCHWLPGNTGPPPASTGMSHHSMMKVLDQSPLLSYLTPLRPNHRRHSFTLRLQSVGVRFEPKRNRVKLLLYWAHQRDTCTIEMFVTPSSTHVVLFIH